MLEVKSKEFNLDMFHIMVRLANLKREPVDPAHLRSCVEQCTMSDPAESVIQIMRELSLPKPRELRKPDEAYCPLLCVRNGQIEIVIGKKQPSTWTVLQFSPSIGNFNETQVDDFGQKARFLRLSFRQRYFAHKSPALRLVTSQVLTEKRGIAELFAATFLISFFAVATSIFSMQVYDRVIPTGAYATLNVLTMGVVLAALLDAVTKFLRHRQVAQIGDKVDQRLARSVFSRFLSVRLDALPASVGNMSQRLRSYEGVRTFILTALSGFLIDLPVAVLFIAVLYALSGQMVAIPIIFMLIGIVLAVFAARRIEFHSQAGLPAHNQKTGHLVESVEGAEVIKSGSGGWRMLGRWLDLSDNARNLDRQTKATSDGFQVLMGLLQQLSYIAIVVAGSFSVGNGSITFGGLIAASILSGRILAPLGTLPNLIVQWATTKASLQDLDRFWQLEQDLDEGIQPLINMSLKGRLALKHVVVEHNNVRALKIDGLQIAAGESIAVLGSIGSGKTTFLRALSGLYRPQQGQILLDDMNIFDMDRAVLYSQLAYVPQDGRLFSGTVRDNLLIGLEDSGDEFLNDVAKKTGLFESVIATHPHGLSRLISEGGQGLSGGQRQLVHITRALMRRPKVWLMDEPTASMDSQSEEQVIRAVWEARSKDYTPTIIFATHKPKIVTLATRIIVLSRGEVALDGPRDAILQRISGASTSNVNIGVGA